MQVHPYFLVFVVVLAHVAATTFECSSAVGIGGLTAQMPFCTAEDPCDIDETLLLASYNTPVKTDTACTGTAWTGLTFVPGQGIDALLANLGIAGGASRDDGAMKSMFVVNNTYYRCEYRHSATKNKPLPLVIYFHGTNNYADHVYSSTTLRLLAGNYELNGVDDGFVLVSVQGMNRHYPMDSAPPLIPGIGGRTKVGLSGPTFDYRYRDFENNEDIVHVDKIIDAAVAEGYVDKSRIYLIGYSTGCLFASMYGLVRYSEETPGGNKVAATAGYSCGDPFDAFEPNPMTFVKEPACEGSVPQNNAPLLLVHRDCDNVRCTLPNDELSTTLSIDQWMDKLRTEGMNAAARRDIVGSVTCVQFLCELDDALKTQCQSDQNCDLIKRGFGHANWPVGYDTEILAFLGAHQQLEMIPPQTGVTFAATTASDGAMQPSAMPTSGGPATPTAQPSGPAPATSAAVVDDDDPDGATDGLSTFELIMAILGGVVVLVIVVLAVICSVVFLCRGGQSAEHRRRVRRQPSGRSMHTRTDSQRGSGQYAGSRRSSSSYGPRRGRPSSAVQTVQMPHTYALAPVGGPLMTLNAGGYAGASGTQYGGLQPVQSHYSPISHYSAVPETEVSSRYS